MKLPLKSIRWRLQLWHGVLLFLVLLAFGLRSYYLSDDNRLSVVDRALVRQSVLISAAMPDAPPDEPLRDAIRKALLGRFMGRLRKDWHVLSNTPEQAFATEAFPKARLLERQAGAGFSTILTKSEQAGFYHVLWQPDGIILLHSDNLPGNIPRPMPDTNSGFQVRTRGEFREQFITAANGAQLLVGCPITAELASLHRLALRLALTGGVIMLLGLAGGWWLSSNALRPLQDISNAAVKIAAGHLMERINVSDTDSELGQLAGVLNDSFDQVQAAFSQLQAALARQVQFTADASHELRTPVSVVLAEANSALARERTPAEYKEALESCRQAARRMRQLTDSLLTLAGLDSDKAPRKRGHCDLQLVTLDVLQLLRPLADEHRVTLQSQLSAGPCLGDPEQLGQIVTNLVSNAIQYNRPGGEVRVRLTSGRRMTVLNIIDTGRGIAPEELPHIFDRFYRADQSRSHTNGHLGLGLSITKAIVEAHGGTIHASSEPGAGSTFTVCLNRPEIALEVEAQSLGQRPCANEFISIRE